MEFNGIISLAEKTMQQPKEKLYLIRHSFNIIINGLRGWLERQQMTEIKINYSNIDNLDAIDIFREVTCETSQWNHMGDETFNIHTQYAWNMS